MTKALDKSRKIAPVSVRFLSVNFRKNVAVEKLGLKTDLHGDKILELVT